ncbi:MAG: flagellar assembly protein FliW [Actinomycetota bacterium]|nr:flagellar assembly protein FliW [Actinomycetota bacterium]
MPAASLLETRSELAVSGGLAGFPSSERYVLDEVVDGGPLFRLTSLDEEGLEFVVAAPGLFFPDYAPVVDDTSAHRLGLTREEDALVLVVLTLGRTAREATANLLAPLVVNRRDGSAAQVIVEGTYPLRAPLRS